MQNLSVPGSHLGHGEMLATVTVDLGTEEEIPDVILLLAILAGDIHGKPDSRSGAIQLSEEIAT